jgi:hypothetical protein
MSHLTFEISDIENIRTATMALQRLSAVFDRRRAIPATEDVYEDISTASQAMQRLTASLDRRRAVPADEDEEEEEDDEAAEDDEEEDDEEDEEDEDEEDDEAAAVAAGYAEDEAAAEEEDDEYEDDMNRYRAIEEVGLQLLRGEVPVGDNCDFIADAALLNRISPQLLRNTLPSDLLHDLAVNTYGEFQPDLQRIDLDNLDLIDDEAVRESNIIQKLEMLIGLLEANVGSVSAAMMEDWQKQLEELLCHIYLYPIKHPAVFEFQEKTIKHLPRAMLALSSQQRISLQKQFAVTIRLISPMYKYPSPTTKWMTMSPKQHKLQVLVQDCPDLLFELAVMGLYWEELRNPNVFKLCTMPLKRQIFVAGLSRLNRPYTSLNCMRKLWEADGIDDFNRWLEKGVLCKLPTDMPKKVLRCVLQNIIPFLIVAVAETGFSSELAQGRIAELMRPYVDPTSELYDDSFSISLSAEGIAEVAEVFQNPNLPQQFLRWLAAHCAGWKDFEVATAFLRREIDSVPRCATWPLYAFTREDVITWALAQDDLCPHLRQAAVVVRLENITCKRDEEDGYRSPKYPSIAFIDEVRQCICPELFMAAERSPDAGFAELLRNCIYVVIPFCSATQIRRLQRGLGSNWILNAILCWYRSDDKNELKKILRKCDLVQLRWALRELLSPDLLHENAYKNLNPSTLLKVAECFSGEGSIEWLVEIVLALPRNIFSNKKNKKVHLEDIDIDKIDPLLLAALCAQGAGYFCNKPYCCKSDKKLRFQWGRKGAWEEFGWTLVNNALVRPLDVRNGPAVDAGGPKSQLFYEVGRQLKGPAGLLEMHPEDGYLLPRLALASGSPPSPADMHLLGRAIARNLLTDSECHLDLDLHPALLIILSAPDLNGHLPAAKKLDVATPNGCTWSWGVSTSLLGGSAMIDLVSPRFKWLEGNEMCLQSILDDIAERYAPWMPAMQNIRLGFQARTRCDKIVFTPQYIRRGLCSERVDMRCFMEVLQVKTSVASPHTGEILDAYRAAFASIFSDWSREQIEELLVFWTGSNSPRLNDPTKPPSLMIRPPGEGVFARTCFYSLEVPLLQMASCHLELVEQLRAVLIQALESQRLSEQQGVQFQDE